MTELERLRAENERLHKKFSPDENPTVKGLCRWGEDLVQAATRLRRELDEALKWQKASNLNAAAADKQHTRAETAEAALETLATAVCKQFEEDFGGGNWKCRGCGMVAIGVQHISHRASCPVGIARAALEKQNG